MTMGQSQLNISANTNKGQDDVGVGWGMKPDHCNAIRPLLHSTTAQDGTELQIMMKSESSAANRVRRNK